MNCDPNTLSRASSCFRCLTDHQLISTRTYLLCRIASHGLSPTPPLDPGPTNPDIADASVTANVIFTWTNPTPQRTTNEIWVSDIQTDGTQSAYALLQTVAGNVSQITDATVPVSVCRLYKVRSCNGTSCTAFSDPVGVSNLYENVQIGAVDLPIVMAFNGLIGFDLCNPLTLSKLRRCKSEWTTSTNGNLSSLSLPLLQTVENDFFIDTSASLTSVSLPALTTVCASSGDLQAGNNPLLQSWNAPNIIFRDPMLINFANDALNVASINQILARGVASGVTGCDFELAGGTNAAPAGQGAVDKATLIGAGNTVNTN